MKRFVKLIIYSAIIGAFCLFHSLLIAGVLIAPTRTLSGKIVQPGKVSVFSEPPGLEVTLDGTEIGKTPLLSKEVEPGTHVIRVEDLEIERGPI